MDKPQPSYAGIVLAGGRSSRMGQNKALLFYKGIPMVTHMAEIVRQCGINDIFISGQLEGFETVQDYTLYGGPVQAICNVIEQIGVYDGYLCVPVDMPLLEAKALQILMESPKGGYFATHPFPFFLKKYKILKNIYSVREFLDANQVPTLPLPDSMQEVMVNTNTPEEWEKILAST